MLHGRFLEYVDSTFISPLHVAGRYVLRLPYLDVQ